MEIRDYLLIIRRRLWVLVAVPVVAALVAMVIFIGRPQQWQSKVEVSVPTLAQNTTSGAVAVYVADFKEYLTTVPVLDQVARDNPGVTRKSIKNGLSASEVGTSDLLTVTFTGHHKGTVEGVARSAAAATLNQSSSPQLGDAKAAVQLAQQRYGQAQAALSQFVNTQSGGLPTDQYREKLANLDALKLAASQARLDLDIPKANGLDAQIPQAQAAINTLLPQVQTYQQLSDQQQQAGSALSSALVRVQDAQSQSVSGKIASTLRSTSPTKVDKAKTTLTSVAIAAGVGLILAALYVTFGELMAAGRARRQREAGGRGPSGSNGAGPVDRTVPVTADVVAAK